MSGYSPVRDALVLSRGADFVHTYRKHQDDPTLAWFIDRNGTCTLADIDDVTRFAIPGSWPRYLGRAAAAAGGNEEPAADTAERLSRLIRTNIGRPPGTGDGGAL